MWQMGLREFPSLCNVLLYYKDMYYTCLDNFMSLAAKFCVHAIHFGHQQWHINYSSIIIIIVIMIMILSLQQVSCASSSTELTNRTRFVHHFGTLATEANLASGFYSIIRYFNWRRVTILLQEENLFEVVCQIVAMPTSFWCRQSHLCMLLLSHIGK